MLYASILALVNCSDVHDTKMYQGQAVLDKWRPVRKRLVALPA